MNLQNVQAQYKDKLTAIKSLESVIGDAAPTEEQLKQHETLVADARNLARTIDTMDASANLKSWGEQSTGSAVAQSYGREAMPDEGNIEGVTADKNGEMYAWKSVGDNKLRTLKSGDYLDAVDGYLRNKALFGEDWRSHMKGNAMKVLNEGQDTAGGFWIPPDFRNQLISKIATTTAVRPNATVITTGRDVVTFPAVNYTADDLYTSGVRFSWQGSSAQSSAISESTNPVAGVLRIPVNLAVAKILVQREQMEDNAFDIMGFVTQKMTETFGLGGEDAYINGNGDGQPLGLANHPTFSIANGSASTVAGVTYSGGYIVSGSSGAVTWQGASNDEPTKGLLGVSGALPPQYEGGANWYANKKTYTQLAGLADTNKRPLWWNTDGNYPNIVNGFPGTLLGYGVKKSQFFADPASDSLSMFLGDMKAYYIVDRVALSVEVYRETYADRDQVMIYARMRTGGQLVDYWKMKALKLGTS